MIIIAQKERVSDIACIFISKVIFILILKKLGGFQLNVRRLAGTVPAPSFEGGRFTPRASTLNGGGRTPTGRVVSIIFRTIILYMDNTFLHQFNPLFGKDGSLRGRGTIFWPVGGAQFHLLCSLLIFILRTESVKKGSWS